MSGIAFPKSSFVPTPPVAPSQDPAQTAAAEEAARLERERSRRGFLSTIQTSPYGVQGQKTVTGA